MAKEEQAPEQEPVSTPEPAVLKPIPVYPAYIVAGYGTIYGIARDVQGIEHRDQLRIAETNGNTLLGKIKFYTVRGILYIVREWTDENGTEHKDCYAQDLSNSGTPCIDLVDNAPEMPDMLAVQFDSPEWLIKTVVISGIEFSYLYNRHDSVWSGAGDGEWVCRKQKITGFVVLEKGILIVSEDGAQFCPSNRKGLNTVVNGKDCRLWR